MFWWRFLKERFIGRIKIGNKINLKILKEANLIVDDEKMKLITQECKELVAIFTSSIKTTNEK